MKTSTGTVVAVVAIAAIALWFVLRQPKKIVPQQQSGSTSTFGGLLALAGPVISSIGGKIQAPSSLPYTSGYDTAAQSSYGLSHGVVEQSGNTLIDLNTGNTLIYDVI